MTLYLHNSVNQAHIEDLKDRLSAQAPTDPYGKAWMQAITGTLVEAVQAMDRGTASKEDTREVFKTFRVPGFSFERWLAEMGEEEIYLETALLQAA